MNNSVRFQFLMTALGFSFFGLHGSDRAFDVAQQAARIPIESEASRPTDSITYTGRILRPQNEELDAGNHLEVIDDYIQPVQLEGMFDASDTQPVTPWIGSENDRSFCRDTAMRTCAGAAFTALALYATLTVLMFNPELIHMK